MMGTKPPVYDLVIFGEPGFKQRARQGKKLRAGKVITYTPKKTRDYEKRVRMEFLKRYPDPIRYYGPLVMDIQAYFNPTLKASRDIHTFYEQVGSGRSVCQPLLTDFVNKVANKISKPDWDNIGKVISDALIGLAYRDDSQLVKVQVSKYWWWGHDLQPSVLVRIWEHDGDQVERPLLMMADPIATLMELVDKRNEDKSSIQVLNEEPD